MQSIYRRSITLHTISCIEYARIKVGLTVLFCYRNNTYLHTWISTIRFFEKFRVKKRKKKLHKSLMWNMNNKKLCFTCILTKIQVIPFYWTRFYPHMLSSLLVCLKVDTFCCFFYPIIRIEHYDAFHRVLSHRTSR